MFDNLELPNETINKMYDDLIHPAAKELGIAGGTVVGLINTVLAPVKIVNALAQDAADKFIQDHQQRISEIPAEKYQEPHVAIVGPMVEHLKYKITEDTLRKYYLNLIASASNSENLLKPLISFDNVLNQLTPTELKLLKHLFSPVVNQNYPLANIIENSSTGYNVKFKYLANIQFENLNHNEISSILSNYERLGLIQISMMEFLQPESTHYAYVKETDEYQRVMHLADISKAIRSDDKASADYNKGMFSTTPFGASFIKTILY